MNSKNSNNTKNTKKPDLKNIPIEVPTRITSKETGEVENACVSATYFGFTIENNPMVSKENKEAADSIRKNNVFVHEEFPPLEEIIATLNIYTKSERMQKFKPAMIYYEGQARGSHKKKKKKAGETIINLHIIGTEKSIAEATLIKIAHILLSDEGHKDLLVDINNVGGKDEIQAYSRELTAYFRKLVNSMPASCRELFKESPYAVMASKTKECAELREEAPSPVAFLADEDRKHFKEVIEFLESQEIEYMMNKDVIGDPFYSTHSVFKITDTKKDNIVAVGSRYNLLAKKAGFKKEIPGAFITITLNKSKKVKRTKVPNLHDSKFYFIQLAFDAKLKSLYIIDELRKSDIPVFQSLSRDRISTQLEVARSMKFPYILIMGQKEALDNTVIIRNASTHSQQSVPIKDLVDHLKKLK